MAKEARRTYTYGDRKEDILMATRIGPSDRNVAGELQEFRNAIVDWMKGSAAVHRLPLHSNVDARAALQQWSRGYFEKAVVVARDRSQSACIC
jgi:hypothetical protein